jgi:hypothetical protein
MGINTPSRSEVHVNRPLTNMSVAFMQGAENFIARRVFPAIRSDYQSDTYFVWGRDDFNRDEMKPRAPGTESEGSGFHVDQAPPFYIPVQAFHKDLPDQVLRNADSLLNLDRATTNFLTMKALIRQEKEWAGAYFQPGVWGTTLAGVAANPAGGQFLRWSDAASDPLAVIKAGMVAMHLASGGFRPNVLVLGGNVYNALVAHPDVLDRVRYGGNNDRPAMVSRQALAALLEIPRIEVMEAIENTAPEGLPETNAYIGGNHAALFHVTGAPSVMTPSAGYRFVWTGYLQGATSEEGTVVSRFRMEHLKSDRVEIEGAWSFNRVATELGYFFQDAV